MYEKIVNNINDLIDCAGIFHLCWQRQPADSRYAREFQQAAKALHHAGRRWANDLHYRISLDIGATIRDNEKRDLNEAVSNAVKRALSLIDQQPPCSRLIAPQREMLAHIHEALAEYIVNSAEVAASLRATGRPHAVLSLALGDALKAAG